MSSTLTEKELFDLYAWSSCDLITSASTPRDLYDRYNAVRLSGRYNYLNPTYIIRVGESEAMKEANMNEDEWAFVIDNYRELSNTK